MTALTKAQFLEIVKDDPDDTPLFLEITVRMGQGKSFTIEGFIKTEGDSWRKPVEAVEPFELEEV